MKDNNQPVFVGVHQVSSEAMGNIDQHKRYINLAHIVQFEIFPQYAYLYLSNFERYDKLCIRREDFETFIAPHITIVIKLEKGK